MAIVNYSTIIFPVSIAMSEGDVIRLNRMYECGPLYEKQQFLQGNESKGETSSGGSRTAVNEIETVKQKRLKLFGMFIFKDIGEN